MSDAHRKFGDPDHLALHETDALRGTPDDQIQREWLLPNGLGGYASSTVLGCPTRRYHGLLVAAKNPPGERMVMLAGSIDRLQIAGQTFDLSTFEFNHEWHPKGYEHIKRFSQDLTFPQPSVEFEYAHELFRVIKKITVISGANEVKIDYHMEARDSERIHFSIQPLIAIRDFHSLRRQAANDPWMVKTTDDSFWLSDRMTPENTLFLAGINAQSEYEPVWWHNFSYRETESRGFSGGEDLLSIGRFSWTADKSMLARLDAVAFAKDPEQARAMADVPLLKRKPLGPTGDSVRNRLSAAARSFIVERKFERTKRSVSIIAGYHWFSDWGRDALIALEGLLLKTGHFEEARQVLETFASAQRNGLIPNYFGEVGQQCSYNSVDASLWFIHAFDAYLAASGDTEAMAKFGRHACEVVIEAFLNGTDFNIGADETGLIRCGDESTQITWMDAKQGGVVMTPRFGYCVEINALWYHALRIMAARFDGKIEKTCKDLARSVANQFEKTFWQDDLGCLADCVHDGIPDRSVRPNQVFAISLAHSPLSDRHRRSILEVVERDLLTPLGLRSLSPQDSRYIGVYEGDPFQRDQAYHNGTVWGWLIGPYVDAVINVRGNTPENKNTLRKFLLPLMRHLDDAGLNYISEIFDGNEPHTPRGCIAQAWSVAELLRAWDKVTS